MTAYYVLNRLLYGLSPSSCAFFYRGSTAPSGPRPPHYRGFMTTRRHTTVGRTTLGQWSARCIDLYMTMSCVLIP